MFRRRTASLSAPMTASPSLSRSTSSARNPRVPLYVALSSLFFLGLPSGIRVFGGLHSSSSLAYLQASKDVYLVVSDGIERFCKAAIMRAGDSEVKDSKVGDSEVDNEEVRS